MKKVFIRILCALFVLLFALSVISCGNDGKDATKISFKSAATYEYLKTLDGQKVTINGYMATSSPVDGSFIFLMNLPYQSCPFCIPNTSQLSNTIEVYPKKKESFSFTNQAVKVVGTLQVAASKDQYFTDEFGYQFNFRIIDATYTILKAEDLSADIALWQSLASSDVVSEIYDMYDYVNFLCDWYEYYVNTFTDSSGNLVPGYYLHPQDAYYYVTTANAQWNYGYKTGYFDNIVAKIRSVDANAFEDLVQNVLDAKALANSAFAELESAYNAVKLNDDSDSTNDVTPNYTREYKYLDNFGRYDYVYTLNEGKELNDSLEELYNAFSNWLSNWEM